MSEATATREDDVLVIGGGVIGLSCALHLLRAGRGVRVLEQGTAGSGSSHGNCGTLTPSHAAPLAAPGVIAQAMRWMLQPDAPLYIRPRFDPGLWRWLLAFARRCNHRDWMASGRAKATLLSVSRRLTESLVAEEGLDCEFSASGLLYVYRDPRSWEKASADIEEVRGFGIRVERWDCRTLEREEPALKPGMAGALHFPDDACLRPDRYVAALARAVRAAGGIIEERCRVLGIDRAGDRIQAVRTERGERRGREVLLAAGAWSPTLARGLGLRLPVVPGKGYSITYSRPDPVPRRPLVLKERSVCVTAWGSGFRLGSTMEFSGYDSRLNPTRLRALVRGAAEYLNAPEGPEHREDWYGWRPMTTDDLPILGRAPGSANLWLATGHGMLGVSMAAVTGRLLTDMIVGRPPVVDPAPCRPERFTAG